MGKCSICLRSDVEFINRDLLAGVSLRKVHDKYGASASALQRHFSHLRTQLAHTEHSDQKEEVTVISAAARIQELERRADAIYSTAISSGDTLNSLRALKELREIVELYAKITGELNQQQTVTHQHLHISPEWTALRSAMLTALQPYPEARAALIEALENVQLLPEGITDVEE